MTAITSAIDVVMTTEEARALTDRIKDTAGQLWALLLEAHERKAWRVLGYGSWREYGQAEFNLSQSHLYRILDQGRVNRALEKASHSPIGEIAVSEHTARQIKPHLELVTAEIQERITDGEEPVTAVRNTISGITKTHADDDEDAEADIEPENPENAENAFLLRADVAAQMAVYSRGPITEDVVGMARKAASAWSKLAESLQERFKEKQ
jgi:hypothetical protein